MQRREFITLLGGGAVVWPLAVRAQQRNAPIVGILVPANPEPFRSEFQAGLRELGYREGQNIAFEFRSAEGNSARLRELADDLARLKVDIIVAALTPAATAARQATTEIPIVMVSVGDPVATGLISSLARPGGNVTGLTSGGAELTTKTIELIREVLPSTKRVAALANAPDPFSKVFVDGVEDAGRKLGVAIQTIKVRGIDDFDAAFNAMVKEQAQAVIVQLSSAAQANCRSCIEITIATLRTKPSARSRRRTDLLFPQSKRPESSCRGVRRSHSKGSQASRSASGVSCSV